VSVAGICYHLLNRGHGRSRVFHDEEDYSYFMRLLRMVGEKVAMRLLACCLMPNHFHLVVWPLEDGDLGSWMHWLMTSHVARHRKKYDTVGSIWQGRYKSFPIQQDQHLVTVLRYVERNPLRSRLVDAAEEWPWSSLRLGIDGNVDGLIHPGPVCKPRDWTTWVNMPQTAAELQALRTSVKRGCPFGDKSWVRETAATLGLEASLHPVGRSRKRSA
jgi:putative transposase